MQIFTTIKHPVGQAFTLQDKNIQIHNKNIKRITLCRINSIMMAKATKAITQQ
jgi:hypothetical protein